MKSKQLRNSFILLLTAFIWGIAFVAQSEGGDAIGPFSFNAIRSLMGAVALLPVIAVLDALKLTSKKPVTKEQKKTTWIAGISCGIILCIATNLQQVGIYLGSPVGKAGFITACYIIMVPILGIALKKKCNFNVWIAVVLAVVGLYLLCMTGELTVQGSDVLILLCALVFAAHILVVDHFSPLTDGVRISCIQFFTCGVIGTVIMLFTEMRPFTGGFSAWAASFNGSGVWISLCYAGIMSSGVAYTLQIIGQDGLNPTVASLIMSLESVFAVLGGAVLLHEYLTARELIGCIFMMIAIVLAQLPVEKLFHKNKSK